MPDNVLFCCKHHKSFLIIAFLFLPLLTGFAGASGREPLASAAWDPDAGLVSPWVSGAVASATSTTAGSDPANVLGGDTNTFWQSGACLPTGYVTRPVLNPLLGACAAGRCTSSGTGDLAGATDGSSYTGANIPLASGQAWFQVSLPAGTTLHAVGARALASPVITLTALTASGPVVVGALTRADNYQYCRFLAPAGEVQALRAESSAGFTLTEIAAQSEPCYEAVTVDLGAVRQVGWVQTRHWAGGQATATTLQASTDGINWTTLAVLDPTAVGTVVTRVTSPVMARYLRVRHQVQTVCNVLRCRDANLPGKPVYVTEWGWDSDGAGESCNASECVSETAQALYPVRAALMLVREGVDRLTWFFYANDKDCDTLFCRSGLTGSANTGFATKASFRALEALVNTLGDRHGVGVLREDDAAWICLLEDADGTPTHLVAWRPVDAMDLTTTSITVSVNGFPGRTWYLSGGTPSGEPAPAPRGNGSTWTLQVSAVPLVVTIEPMQKGISYAAWWSGKYASPDSDLSLARLAATGANWIALIVTGYQDTIASTTIYTNTATSTDADLIHAIDRAHTLGLKVMLKPHLDLWNDPSHWRGQIGQAFTSEAQWQAWFASYRQFINHYAELAEAHGVEQFAVGTELSGTVHREADWRTVIAGVRARFSGPITYAANHSGEETGITWWDAVDYTGVDAYYPLTDKNDPTLAELKAGWVSPLASLSALAATWNKPIIFTEIGYRSQDGTNRHPWDWQSGGTVDLQEQADAYRAAFESVFGQPWFAGMFWWSWGTDPYEGGPCDMGYTPHDKPAEDVLRSWYGAPPRSSGRWLQPDESVTLPIYGDSLAPGWQDWSWSAARSLFATDQVYSGTHAISVTLGAWGGLSFWHAPFVTDTYTWLDFHVRGAPGASTRLWAFFYDDLENELRKRPVDDCRYIDGGTIDSGVWKRVLIPLSHLDAADRPVSRVAIQDRGGQGAAFWVDEIRLVGARACYDFDGDGLVGLGDLSAIAGRWRTASQYDPAYDLVADGRINVLDVIAMARGFGDICVTVSP